MTSILKVDSIQNAAGASEIKIDTIKNATGTAAMAIDSAGRVVMPARPMFNVGRGTPSGVINTGTSYVNFAADIITSNIGNHYNSTLHRFVCPVDGVYSFHFYTIFASMTNGGIMFKVNGSTVAIAHCTNATANWNTVTLPLVTSISANDYVEAFWDSQNGNFHSSPYCKFYGYLVG